MVGRGSIHAVFVVVAGFAASCCESRSATAWADLIGDRGLGPELSVELRTKRLRRPRIPKRTATIVDSTAATGSTGAPDAFTSPEICLALLERGERVRREPSTARILSWNVRWFPDGVAGTAASGSSTDVEWLACTIAWLNVDVVALAEIKPWARSGPALDRLIARLDGLTGGKHLVRLDECPDQNGQHVAWLVDERRVAASDFTMHAAINPRGGACVDQLRPGLGVSLKFPGGLDLHAIAVHLKSGVNERDIGLRRASFDGLERTVTQVAAQTGDSDILVAGDLNSMGCRACPEISRSAAEAGWLDTRLSSFQVPMRRIGSDLGCSFYYQQNPTLLDHFLVARAMFEAPVQTHARVFGPCRSMQCAAYDGPLSAAATRLSDHCPIALDLVDRDLD